MQAQVKLGRIAGISIGLHYSWFIIAFLIAVSLADHFHTVTPEWSKAVVWSAAIITGVLFFVALITPHEVKGVDPERWAQTSVQSAMRPLAQLQTVTADTPAIQALEVMSRNDINQPLVVSNGRVEGFLSRSYILCYLQTHAELQRR